MRRIEMRRPGDDQRDDDGPLREAALARLVAALVARRARNELRPGEVGATAAEVGIGERTLWRWIAAGRPPQHRRASLRRTVLSQESRDAYVRLGGYRCSWYRPAGAELGGRG